MLIKWYGHSCFYIESEDGIRIVTDPFDPTVGYEIPELEADVVTVSHNHFDHNYTDGVEGDFEVINEQGNYDVDDVTIKGIKTFHDASEGQQRGQNIVFNINLDGVNVCHMGDIGHTPDNGQMKEIGSVDILLVPIGGTFTVDAKGAIEIIERLNPKIVIPIHYKTPDLKFNLGRLEQFTEMLRAYEVVNLKQLNVTSANINDYSGKLIVFDYLH